MSIPEVFVINGKGIQLTRWDDRDPRGIVFMWEPPLPRATYVIAVDPTVGIVNWHRSLRTQDDSKTDNGAIEVVRAGLPNQPDVQVCEYAAPIDPEDLADVANFLGRIYAGAAEDGQAHCIIEVHPGPGLITLRRMLNVHGYTNHFVWRYLDSLSTTATSSLGFTASPRAVRDLWIRGSRHIQKNGIIINSPDLIEEMSYTQMDPHKMAGNAISGKHDDRIRAIMLALWDIHDWNSQVETVLTPEVRTSTEPKDWRAMDVTADQMQREWNETISEWGNFS